MKFNFITVSLTAATLLFSASCVKDDNRTATNGNGNESAEVFTYATDKQITLRLDYGMSYRVPVEIYTANPIVIDGLKNYAKVEGVEPVAKGWTDGDGKVELTLCLASAATDLYVYSSSVGAPMLLHGSISDKQSLALTAADEVDPASGKARQALTGTDVYWKNWATQHISPIANPAWSWDGEGRPAYLLDETLALSSRTLEIIDKTIPEGVNNLSYSQLETIAISEDAHVKLYYVSNSSARRNALAYYTYTGNEPSQEQINRSLTVLYPNLSADALRQGEGVQLAYREGGGDVWSDVFPAGTKIGFVLLVDAWANSSVATSDVQAVYSRMAFNSYNYLSVMSNRPHMAAFSADGNFILSFEDLPWNESPRSEHKGDFADNIFILTADPVTALPDVESGISPDEEPDYGMEMASKGIVLFEDNWPYQGDYDLNDVVFKYDSKYYLNTEWDITALDDKYVFVNNGGQYRNALGLEYSFPIEAIGEIAVSATNGVATPELDTDAEMTKTTLMLFEDASKVPSGTVFTVKIVFKEPLMFYGYKTAPYNPFLTINDSGTLRKEVHLPNYTPTPKADPAYLGYGDDKSDPSKGLYYINSSAYPFAINLTDAESYHCPAEGVRIDVEYPDFIKWVESNGKQYKDWYLK